MPLPNKLRVLFVCLGNACRSPMAESIARKHASDILDASSAGLYPLGRVEGLTIQTLLANGYPTDSLSSKLLVPEAVDSAQLIINLSGESLERWLDGPSNGAAGLQTDASIEHWPVADPYGQDPATYQRILEEIESRVLSLTSRLRADQPTAGT